MPENYHINEKTNYFKNLRWKDLSLYKKSAIADAILNISLLSKNFHRSVRDEGVINESIFHELEDSFFKAQPERDEISSMIIIKMTLQLFEVSPWLNLNQIIYYLKSKGGRFTSLSRDTFERRVSSLCNGGELEKTKLKSLPNSEIKKISFNKTFKYVYRISPKANKIYEMGSYNVEKAAPLDKFLNSIISIIQLLPEDAKKTIIKSIDKE